MPLGQRPGQPGGRSGLQWAPFDRFGLKQFLRKLLSFKYFSKNFVLVYG